MRGILDTSVLIADAPTSLLEGEFAISSISLAELHFGVLVARSDGVRAERLRRLSVIQRGFYALPVDEAVAASYGHLASAVAIAGRQPRRRTLDLLIAAAAHVHGARLYTHNTEDFRGLEDLVEVVGIAGSG